MKTEPADAWLLELDSDRRAAIGGFEIAHVLADDPALFEIPKAPDHCRRALIWQDRMLAVMDLPAWLDGARPARERSLIAIVRYRDLDRADTGFGALVLGTAPRRVQVVDEQACDLPAPEWKHLAIACFEHSDHGPVPVLDLAHIFSGPLPRAHS